MDATLQDPLVGRLLDGRYLVESRIARGGMATVYLALDRRLDREIALKVMHPHLADDDEFVARFIREARSAARLSHPNVVQVFDQGADGELLYLAMEYLQGRTLREVLSERGVLTPREALTVVEPVLDALSAAHRAGIVHRDVKPENVVLTDEGRVKVADFGLARAVTGGPTQTGALIGTVAYLSPELVARGIADARSDVYAAGIMLFEMLTGRQPFTGEIPMQVAYRHVHEDVPAPSTLAPELPTELDDVVLAAVARDPDERPPDAAAWLRFVRSVHAGLDDDTLDHRPAPPPGRTTGRSTRSRGLAGSGRPGGAGLLDEDDDGEGTQLLAPAPVPLNPTQALPPTSRALGQLRERARRDEREADGLSPEDEDLQRLAQARRRRGVIALVAVLVLALVLGVVGWWNAAGPGAYEQVPPLRNLSEAEAKAKLAALDLEGKAGPGAYDDTIPKGNVVSSDPDSGRQVRKGGTVTYQLSLGTAVRTVPKIVGLSVDDATAALQKQGLVVGQTQQDYDDKVPQGSVVSSSPGAGKPLKVGDPVALVVSKGPAPTDVPDVTNKPQQEALGLLADKGLKADTGQQEYNNDVPAGSVIRQDPDANATAKRGDTVKLVISKGPQLVTIPDGLVGRQARDVGQQLRDLGLDPRFNRILGGIFGTVRNVTPGSGTQVPPGTEVVIDVV